MLKAGQSLFADADASVDLPNGKRIELASYAQVGDGVLPIHYLFDSAGRPQLITQSLVSWALQGIGN